MEPQFDWEKKQEAERRRNYAPRRGQGPYGNNPRPEAYEDGSFKSKYLSFSGRLNRLAYFLRALGVSIIGFIIIIALAYLGGIGGPVLLIPAAVVIVIVVVFMVVIGISLAVRRLHDMNLSGLYYIGYLLLNAVAGGLYKANPQSTLSIVVNMAVLVVSLLILFWPGTKGPNNYGPDPLNRDGGRVV